MLYLCVFSCGVVVVHTFITPVFTKWGTKRYLERTVAISPFAPSSSRTIIIELLIN